MNLMIESLSGKNRISESFRELARDVAQTNGLVANVDEILFLVDEEKTREGWTASDIGTVPAMLHDIVFQLTLKRFQFYVKFVARSIESVSTNVFSALLYHELRHIKKSAKTGLLYLDKRHDIEDWEEMTQWGDWERVPNAGLPNFMEEAPHPRPLSINGEGRKDGFNGGKSFGTVGGVGVSGVGGGVFAVPLGEGAKAIESGYRELETLSGLHCERGECE